MIDESEILKKLIIDEKDVTRDLEKLIDEATKIFKIEKPSGRIIFQNFSSLSDKQRILVVLIGKYFANRLGIIGNAAMSISEIAKELGRPVTSLSGPMRDIVKQGFVEILPEKKYGIAYHRIKEIFDKMLPTTNGR
ncbi:MAG: hypothetical protein WCE94_13815 [Candidatus Methanoperedens sp.]